MKQLILYDSLKITLEVPRNNATYSAIVRLYNRTLYPPPRLGESLSNVINGTNSTGIYDHTGASYYVILVVLVYALSIVMLIASHINRRHDKIIEDKQINKYLMDF